jgi:putative ABC transport system permease protein
MTPLHESPAGSWIVRLAASVVPTSLRSSWKEEWLAELEALERARASRPADGRLPSPHVFALGALRHAISLRRDEWTMDSVLQDVRFATRVLLRSPGFTLLTALTLALGIGANGAIFSFVNGVLLRPPAEVHRPEQLVQIGRSYESAPRWDGWSWRALELIRSEGDALSGVAGYSPEQFVLGSGDDAEALSGQVVTADYFEVLGVEPFAGRLLQPADDEQADAPVVVLAHSLWKRRFASDPSLIGRTIRLGSREYQVVGVAPEGFVGPSSLGSSPVVWVSAVQELGGSDVRAFNEWGYSWLDVFGRVKDGVTLTTAEASMQVVTARLREAYPDGGDVEVLLTQGVGMNPELRAQTVRLSWILIGIVGLVLLLACSNVASLQITRATVRHTEVGVRMALGAGRPRVARQLLTEGVLLAVLATAMAIPMVIAAERILPWLSPYPLTVSFGVDVRVFAFLSAAGLGAGILFSAAPVWIALRRDLLHAIRGNGTAGHGRSRLRDGLVVIQLALSLSLVAAGALLARSVLKAATAQPGFAPQGIVAGWVEIEPTGRYDPVSGGQLVQRIVEEAEKLPGVESATWSSQIPLAGSHSRASVFPSDRQPEEGYEAETVLVGPSYFETLAIPVILGRGLGRLEDEPEPVVVVNEALAARFWPGENAIGKEISFHDTAWRIVGVVADVQMRSLREPGNPGVYYPIAQTGGSNGWLQVRFADRPDRSALRDAVARIDADLPVFPTVDLAGALTASMGETRTTAYLLTLFAGLALVLASVGLYGLVSFAVAQRRREMALRLAIGAAPESLVRLVVARGALLTMTGVLLGLGLILGLGRFVEGLLYEVAPRDAGSIGSAVLVLVVSAGIAAWIPARRVMRVEPSVTLRD